MADDVTLPGTGAVVETIQQADGSHRQVIALGAAESAALISVLKAIANPITFDPITASTRVSGSVNVSTLPTLNSVINVSNLSGVGGMAANTLVNDMMQTAWALNVRARIK
jgi:hypothetical protein